MLAQLSASVTAPVSAPTPAAAPARSRPRLKADNANLLRLGRLAFVVQARCEPPCVNDNPPLTWLLGINGPLEVVVTPGTPGLRPLRPLRPLHLRRRALLFKPGVQRQVAGDQAFLSLVLEPGHPAYAACLAWARDGHDAGYAPQLAPQVTDADVQALAQVGTAQALDAWPIALLHRHHRPPASAQDERLAVLFTLIAAQERGVAAPTAESIWRPFTQQFPMGAAQRSRLMQALVGMSLRELLLWRKLRRAMDMLGAAAQPAQPNATNSATNPPTNPATQVAHEAGFADSAHLSRTCLRSFGLRPTDAANSKIIQALTLPDA